LRKAILKPLALAPPAAKRRAIMTAQERKVEAMHRLAQELGYFCAPATTFMIDLASKVAGHMKNRSGLVVYQSAAQLASSPHSAARGQRYSKPRCHPP
jgi:hypothetical protein